MELTPIHMRPPEPEPLYVDVINGLPLKPLTSSLDVDDTTLVMSAFLNTSLLFLSLELSWEHLLVFEWC